MAPPAIAAGTAFSDSTNLSAAPNSPASRGPRSPKITSSSTRRLSSARPPLTASGQRDAEHVADAVRGTPPRRRPRTRARPGPRPAATGGTVDTTCAQASPESPLARESATATAARPHARRKRMSAASWPRRPRARSATPEELAPAGEREIEDERDEQQPERDAARSAAARAARRQERQRAAHASGIAAPPAAAAGRARASCAPGRAAGSVRATSARCAVPCSPSRPAPPGSRRRPRAPRTRRTPSTPRPTAIRNDVARLSARPPTSAARRTPLPAGRVRAPRARASCTTSPLTAPSARRARAMPSAARAGARRRARRAQVAAARASGGRAPPRSPSTAARSGRRAACGRPRERRGRGRCASSHGARRAGAPFTSSWYGVPLIGYATVVRNTSGADALQVVDRRLEVLGLLALVAEHDEHADLDAARLQQARRVLHLLDGHAPVHRVEHPLRAALGADPQPLAAQPRQRVRRVLVEAVGARDALEGHAQPAPLHLVRQRAARSRGGW